MQHFIVDQTSKPGQFRFEGDYSDSMNELLNYYKTRRMPVTQASGLVLVSPVSKVNRGIFGAIINLGYGHTPVRRAVTHVSAT